MAAPAAGPPALHPSAEVRTRLAGEPARATGVDEGTPMTERGAVHTYRPKWTEAGPDGRRRLVTGKSWCWRFTFRKKPYGECGDKRTGLPFRRRADALAAGERRKAEVVAGYIDDPHKTTFAALAAIIAAAASTKSARTKAGAKGVAARLQTYFHSDEPADGHGA